MKQEPVAWVKELGLGTGNGGYKYADGVEKLEVGTPLYTAPRELSDEIDYEAIAWALQKLHNFGVTQNSMDNAIMADRLEAILKKASEK